MLRNSRPFFAVLVVMTVLSGATFARGDSGSGALPIPDIIDGNALLDGTQGKAAMDPCTNFYQFACGNWLNTTQIPADKNSVYRPATALVDQTDERLNDILKRLAQGDPTLKTAVSQKVADYYSTCMNVSSTRSAAQVQFKNKLGEIGKLQNSADVAQQVAQFQLFGSSPFFAAGSSQNLHDSKQVILYLVQSGMSLPEPSYYSATDAKSVEIRAEYLKHIEKMFTLMGQSSADAQQSAKTILALETDLASQAYPKEKSFDPASIDHAMSLAELKKLAPQFDWDSYFKVSPAPSSAMNIAEPEFMAHMSEILSRTPVEQIKTYFTWKLLVDRSESVDPAYEQELFRFWQSYLNGAKQMLPRWKTCTQAVEKNLGYALSEVYVQTLDPKHAQEIRDQVAQMTSLIKQAFQDDFKEISSGKDAWMDLPTVTEAYNKLNRMKQKIGAPTQWRDYSALTTDQNSYFSNEIKVSEFEARRDLAKIGKPVDHQEWQMMTWEYNAYYDPSENEFVLPFGILVPPSFDLKANPGVNLATLGGGTIGHELTHGFDNNGRQQDADGNLRNWWSDPTLKKFQSSSRCFIDQANSYTVDQVGMTVNGTLTLSENLADQGGVKMGYAVLQSQLKNRPAGPVWLNRYNENQQFWIGYAQSWCNKRTDENLRKMMRTNEHPPEEFRVNGVLMNRDEFARDFNCKAGDPMAPVNRCSIW